MGEGRGEGKFAPKSQVAFAPVLIAPTQQHEDVCGTKPTQAVSKGRKMSNIQPDRSLSMFAFCIVSIYS
jgi:hypothetical protein